MTISCINVQKKPLNSTTEHKQFLLILNEPIHLCLLARLCLSTNILCTLNCSNLSFITTCTDFTLLVISQMLNKRNA